MAIFNSYVKLPEGIEIGTVWISATMMHTIYYYVTILMQSWLDNIGYMFTHTNAFNAVLLAILKRSKRGSKYASQVRIASFHRFHLYPKNIKKLASLVTSELFLLISDSIHRKSHPFLHRKPQNQPPVWWLDPFLRAMGFQWGVKK